MNLYRQHREALAAIERDYPLPPRSSATYRGVQRQRAEARRQVQARMQRLATELGVELPDTIH